MTCSDCKEKGKDLKCSESNPMNNGAINTLEPLEMAKNETKLPKIIGGFLNITQKCNLKCKYCFVVQQPIDMEYRVAKDSIDFYANNAKETNETPSVNFFGGEPLLRWDDIIVPLVNYIREEYGQKFDIGITTNGVLLDEDKLRFMRKFNIGLLMSIDGNKKTQDLNRPFHNGKGSFDFIKDKIDLVLKYYPQMTFRATVDHDNVYDMLDNYNFAVSKGYTNVFMIPNVFIEWSKEEKEELKRQLTLIADRYMELLREGKRVEFNEFQARKRDVMQLNNLKNGEYRTAGVGKPAFGRCGLGASKFGSIGMSGNIYSCQEMVENPEDGETFRIGNIYTGVDEGKRWQISETFDPRNVRRSDIKSCRECILNRVCTGGCSVNNYFATGSLEVMPSVLCDYYHNCTVEYMRIMKTMAEEKNELFAITFR